MLWFFLSRSHRINMVLFFDCWNKILKIFLLSRNNKLKLCISTWVSFAGMSELNYKKSWTYARQNSAYSNATKAVPLCVCVNIYYTYWYIFFIFKNKYFLITFKHFWKTLLNKFYLTIILLFLINIFLLIIFFIKQCYSFFLHY